MVELLREVHLLAIKEIEGLNLRIAELELSNQSMSDQRHRPQKAAQHQQGVVTIYGTVEFAKHRVWGR